MRRYATTAFAERSVYSSIATSGTADVPSAAAAGTTVDGPYATAVNVTAGITRTGRRTSSAGNDRHFN